MEEMVTLFSRMRASEVLVLIVLLTACAKSSTAGPGGFDVRVNVVGALTSFGHCDVTWAAKATDPTILVNYQGNSSPYAATDFAGGFRDTVSLVWDQFPSPVTVGWVVSAGTWGKQGR